MGEMIPLVVLLILLVAIFIYKNMYDIPHGWNWIIERRGKFHRIAKPTIRFIWFHPYIDRIRAKLPITEQRLDITDFEAFTKDKVFIDVKAFVLYKILDAEVVAYEAPKYEPRIVGMVKGSIRTLFGEMLLDEVLAKKGKFGGMIKSEIEEKAKGIGIEIRAVGGVEITPPEDVREAIDKRAAAKLEKDAKIHKAQADLETARIHAQVHNIHAESSAHAIQKINEVNETGDKQMPLNYILGEKYLDTLKKFSNSENSKFVVYPADLQNSMKGFMGLRAIDPNLKDENDKEGKS